MKSIRSLLVTTFLSILLSAGTAAHANELLINGDTKKDSHLPLLVSFANYGGTEAQSLFSAEQLTEIGVNGTIDSVTFYPRYSGCDTVGATYTIRLFEVQEASLAGNMADTTGGTIVYEGPLPYCNGKMQVVFTTPYIYQGGHLVIDCFVSTPSSKGINFMVFYSSKRTNAGHINHWTGSNWYHEPVSWQPKAMFYYTPPADFCSRPEHIALSHVSHTDATVSWTPGNRETAWVVTTDSLTTVVSSPSYTFANLTPGTAYRKEISVRALCGSGDTSAVSSATLLFNTDCYDATLPYACDFERFNPNKVPPCWTFSGDVTIASGASSAYEGTNYLSMKGYSGTAYAISPKLGVPANKVLLTFCEREYAQYGNWAKYGQCIVGTITDPTDTSTFTPIDTLQPSRSGYQYAECMLTNAPATDYYVMFFYNGYDFSGITNYCYIDSLVLHYMPTCYPVSDIRLDTVSATTADLSWTPGKDEQAWDVVVLDASGDTLFNNTVNTNRCTVSALTHGTPYAISVSINANCGDGDISRVRTAAFSFKTPIACGMPIVTLPLTENFESTEVNQMPACWSKIISKSGSSTAYPSVYSSYAFCHSQTNSLLIRGNNYGIYTILPEFAMDVNTLQINLWTCHGYVAPNHGSFIVGAMSDPGNKNTFFPIDTLPQSENYTEHLVYLDKAPDGYKYIAILYDRFENSSSWTEAMGLIDDITVDRAPVCLAIEDIALDSTGPDNATFSWVPMRADPYGYEVSVTDLYDNSVLLSDTVFQPSVRISGLAYSRSYKLAVSVATICSPGKNSEPYEETFVIATECMPTGTEYKESFELFEAYPYKAQSITTPNCWSVIHANSAYYSQRIYATGSYAHTGKQSLIYNYSTYYPSYAVMPETGADMSTMQISFFYRLRDNYRSGKLTLGYFTDILADSAFVPVLTVTPQTTWDSIKYYRLENVPADARLAFQYYNPDMPNSTLSDASLLIDDIWVEEINNCHPPVSIWYDSLTSCSVQIHWKPEFEENTLFNVAVMYGRDTLFSAKNYADTTCLIEHLQFAKYYVLECHISTACGERTSDMLKSYVSFVTDCAPFAVPFAENFDENKFPLMAGDIPFCWQQWGDRRTGMAYWNIGSFNDGSITHSGGGVLDLYADTASWSIVALPEFETSVDSLKLSFYSRVNSTDADRASTLEAGYLPDPSDSSSFVLVAVIPKHTQYTLSTVTFCDAPDDVHHIAFRFSGGDILCQANMDDITVERISTQDTESIQDEKYPAAVKIIHNGKLYILRDGKTYTVLGASACPIDN